MFYFGFNINAWHYYISYVFAYFCTKDIPWWMPKIVEILLMVVRLHHTLVIKYLSVSKHKILDIELILGRFLFFFYAVVWFNSNDHLIACCVSLMPAQIGLNSQW